MPMPNAADMNASGNMQSTATAANYVETAAFPDVTNTTTAGHKAAMTDTVTLHARNTVHKFCPMAARWYVVLLPVSGADAMFQDGKAASGITATDVGDIA